MGDVELQRRAGDLAPFERERRGTGGEVSPSRIRDSASLPPLTDDLRAWLAAHPDRVDESL